MWEFKYLLGRGWGRCLPFDPEAEISCAGPQAGGVSSSAHPPPASQARELSKSPARLSLPPSVSVGPGVAVSKGSCIEARPLELKTGTPGAIPQSGRILHRWLPEGRLLSGTLFSTLAGEGGTQQIGGASLPLYPACDWPIITRLLPAPLLCNDMFAN